MNVTINGEKKILAENITVFQLLEDMNLNPEVTIVEKNGTIIKRDQYDSELVEPDDSFELIRFMGGG